ncbi:MAG: hypothetical protein Q9175_006658 [Cornicularia normoerica]
MAISLKPDFTFFSGHPALKTVCQEMPELMNQILTQSFANITALSDTFPLLHFLPQSENNDPLSHAWELEKAKQCYFEAFPTTRYFSIENYASVRAATFNMIVSRVYRKLDLLETYPALDNEESRLDSTRIRSTASNLKTSSKDEATSSTKHKHFYDNWKELSNGYPWIPLPQWREGEPKTKVALPSIGLQNTRYVLDRILEKVQDGTSYEYLNTILQRAGTS